MKQVSLWYWIHCLSPLHVGTGEGSGVIDMPIQREKVTEWPVIPGSTLKGVQRDYYYRLKGLEDAQINQMFGKQGDQDAAAGALVITDGRILAFPVASRYGTFAYVTCPLVLKRLQRDAHAAGLTDSLLLKHDWDQFNRFNNSSKSAQSVWVSEKSVVCQEIEKQFKVFLDEFTGVAEKSSFFSKWANVIGKHIFADESSRQLWEERVVLVTDDTFQYFTTMCCEVTPRIRINEDTKTVADRALWYEEYVPAETIFYGLIWCDRVEGSVDLGKREELLKQLDSETALQIGGNISVGKGRVRCRLSGGND